MKIEDHERFSNVASGIQNIVVIVAVVIGGLFTLSTFLLGDWAEHSRRQNLGLSINVKAKQEEKGPDPNHYYISAVVEITNRGSAPRSVEFEEVSPLRVETIDFDEQGRTETPVLLFIEKNPNAMSRVIRSEETVNYPFLVRVKNKGFYRVSLWVKLNKDERKVHEATVGNETSEDIFWDGQTIVLVK